jgi:molecular chaperone DnaK (HSP70)
VGRLLKEKFRKPVKSDLNPDEVVAIGAGWMAKKFRPSLGAELRDNAERTIDPAAPAPTAADHRDVKDVVSHTLGIGLKDDLYDPLISKDSVIPHRVVRDGYSTSEDNQTSIYVPIFQGENSRASLNTKLGQVVIDGLTPEPKGTHRFSITFGLDANGIFSGEIKHQQTGVTKEIKLDRGQEQITEKKRVALAEMVSGGTVNLGTAPATAAGAPVRNALDELVRRTYELMDKLQPAHQQELRGVLDRLNRARALNDATEQTAAFAQLAMVFARHERA